MPTSVPGTKGEALSAKELQGFFKQAELFSTNSFAVHHESLAQHSATLTKAAILTGAGWRHSRVSSVFSALPPQCQAQEWQS